ncbi:MAG TPA: hypothetical protein DEA96_05160 [Leptospiraceae bacterium]|nr:hypothetical protein [Spirochaetaceae bacterium]HBS04334.1 hypothetical protein [Leptospiraceae bacterium]|tara:strand:+ start:5816 stop:6409 length:594 start_codon:yes stop_codon:yes gene_type:complete
MRFSIIILGAILLMAPGCTRDRQGVPNSHPGFEIHKGVMLFKGEPFTGIRRTELPGGWRETPYVEGKIQGVEHDWYNDGRMASERPHENGKRVGIHKGWYPDGNRKFFIEYQDGFQNGESFTWHANGKLYTYSQFVDGKPIGHKTWRYTGQIYSNYVQVGNRGRIGLIGSDLCNGVEATIPEIIEQSRKDRIIYNQK